jgi:hypothetical protein
VTLPFIHRRHGFSFERNLRILLCTQTVVVSNIILTFLTFCYEFCRLFFWERHEPYLCPLSTTPRPYPLVQPNSDPLILLLPSFFEMAFLLCISLGWTRSWLTHETPQSVASSLMLGLDHRKYSRGL